MKINKKKYKIEVIWYLINSRQNLSLWKMKVLYRKWLFDVFYFTKMRIYFWYHWHQDSFFIGLFKSDIKTLYMLSFFNFDLIIDNFSHFKIVCFGFFWRDFREWLHSCEWLHHNWVWWARIICFFIRGTFLDKKFLSLCY